MNATNQSTECACTAAPKLIFACSGAADVGSVADRAARTMTREGTDKMCCLAAIAGRVDAIIATTKAAAAILAIDGCPSDCARKTLEEAGFTQFEHLRLSDLGMEKGKSPATEANIAKAVERGKTRLAGRRPQSEQR